MVKKFIVFVDAVALTAFICVPELFIPGYLLFPPWDPRLKGASSVAIIGGNPDSIFAPIVTKAHLVSGYVFPLAIILILCNFYYLFVFLKNRFRKK